MYDRAIAGNKWFAKKGFGHENLGRPQSSLRDIRCSRQHDDGSVRLGPSRFNCKLARSSRAWTSIRHRRVGRLHVLKIAKCKNSKEAPLKVDSARPSLA